MMSNNDGEDTTAISPALENALRILRGYRSEVETELKHLNGGMASVSDGISKLYNKSQSWENVTDALNLSLQYVSNILKNPDDARCWRIRNVNPIFHRRIGRHGLDIANTIMSSIGFDTSVVNKEVYVLKSTEGGSANSKFRFPTLEKTIAACSRACDTSLFIGISHSLLLVGT